MSSANFLKDQGDKYFEKCNFKAAIKFWTLALEQNPNNEKIYSNRSHAYYLLQSYKKSLQDAKSAISFAPNWPTGYLRKGEAETGLGQLEESEKTLQYAVALEASLGLPNDPRIMNALMTVRNELATRKNRLKEDSVPDWCGTAIRQVTRSTLVENALKDASLEIMPATKYYDMRQKTFPIIIKAHNLRDEQHNYPKAAKLYLQAAQLGDAEGMHNLALMYQTGTGVEKSFEQYFFWIRKAAAEPAFTDAGVSILGVAHAQNSIGVSFRDGIAVHEKNDEEAEKWFRLAAENGLCIGQNNLGCQLQDRGEMVQARYWFERSAEQKYARAMFNLAQLLFKGLGGVQDVQQAWFLVEEAANLGYTNAIITLTIRVYDSDNSNISEAISYFYSKIANWETLTEAEDFHFIAFLHIQRAREQERERSTVLTDDEKIAVAQLAKAVELGFYEAYSTLADIYSKKGLIEKEIEILVAASKRKYAPAMFRLAKIHGYGKYLARDREESLKWLNKAICHGSIEARQEYEKIRAVVSMSDKEYVKFADEQKLCDALRYQTSFEKLGEFTELFKKLSCRPKPQMRGVPVSSHLSLFSRILNDPEQLLQYAIQHSSSKVAQKLMFAFQSFVKYLECIDCDEKSIPKQGQNQRQREIIIGYLFDTIMHDEKVMSLSPESITLLISLCDHFLEQNEKDLKALVVRAVLLQSGLEAAVLVARSSNILSVERMSRLYEIYGSELCFAEEWRKAIVIFQLCFHVNPQEHNCLYSLSVCHENLGEHSKAKNYLLRFIEKAEPDNFKLPHAYYALALRHLTENPRNKGSVATMQTTVVALLNHAKSAEESRLWLFDPITEENFAKKKMVQLLFHDMNFVLEKETHSSKVVCFACGLSGEKLKRCKRCEEAFYCNLECQKQDWKRHKTKCKKK